MTLEELLKAATPGPWKLVPDEYGEPAQCLQSYGFDIATLWGGYNAGEANAYLIVKAPLPHHCATWREIIAGFALVALARIALIWRKK